MRVGLVLVICLLISAASAQERANPDPKELADAPSVQQPATVPAPSVVVDPSPSVHRFWDRKNVLLFSGVAAFRALDFASTKNFMARGRTEVLIPDDIVENNAGFASLEAAATMTSVGISYIFHRTGHHKMERWVSIVHLSVTTFGDAHNYALKSKHP